jgi:phage terminase small subunit
MGLTLKQQRFVHNYIENDGNATQAAIQAGYNTNYDTIRNIASENLTKPNIKKAIEEKTAEILNPEQIKRKISEKTNSKNEAIQLKACELLGRTYAMFIDKTINENRNYDGQELDKIREKALQEAEESLRSVLPVAEGHIDSTPKTEQKEQIDSLNSVQQ